MRVTTAMGIPKDFGFGPEEQMVRDSARKLLSEASSIARVRALVAGDSDPYRPPASLHDLEVWSKIVELGWTALAVPGEVGGLAMKMVAVAAVAEEAGRHALPSPLIATLTATFVLREAGTVAARSALAAVVAGRPATLAVLGSDGGCEAASCEVRFDGEALTGRASYVQDAGKAELFVISATDANGAIGLYALPADAPGLRVELDQIVDLTRDQGTLHLARVPVKAEHRVATHGEGSEVLSRALPAVWTVIAADMTGASEWLLQTTAAYAKVREQFGHPIGAFQAVKHPIVDMMLAVDQSRSLVYAAAAAIDEAPEDAERLARMAKARASDAAGYCCGRAVQLHGGVAFTWECDVHLYFKRNKHNQFLFGDAAHHRAKIADLLMGSLGR